MRCPLWARIAEFPEKICFFVRNLWRFRKQLWQFRYWDWEHNYEFFFETLRDTRDHIAADKHHERWQQDVRGINVVLARWEHYKTAMDHWDGGRATLDPVMKIEQHAWELGAHVSENRLES